MGWLRDLRGADRNRFETKKGTEVKTISPFKLAPFPVCFYPLKIFSGQPRDLIGANLPEPRFKVQKVPERRHDKGAYGLHCGLEFAHSNLTIRFNCPFAAWGYLWQFRFKEKMMARSPYL